MPINLVKSLRIALMLLFFCIAGEISAQTVKGTVKDNTGEPIIGATVKEKGTTNGTVTDVDGNFILKVSGKKSLVVSYLGMKQQVVDAVADGTPTIRELFSTSTRELYTY